MLNEQKITSKLMTNRDKFVISTCSSLFMGGLATLISPWLWIPSIIAAGSAVIYGSELTIYDFLEPDGEESVNIDLVNIKCVYIEGCQKKLDGTEGPRMLYAYDTTVGKNRVDERIPEVEAQIENMKAVDRVKVIAKRG